MSLLRLSHRARLVTDEDAKRLEARRQAVFSSYRPAQGYLRDPPVLTVTPERAYPADPQQSHTEEPY